MESARAHDDAASEWFNKALQIDPAYALALDPVFTAKLAAGDLEGGEKLLRLAADYEPGSAQVQGLHGASLKFLGRNEEALAAFQRALAITPDDPDLLYETAKTLQGLDRQAEAITMLGRAIEIDPYRAGPIFSRGTSLAMTGNNAAARADFDRVLELDTSGTQYASMASGLLDILDGLDAAAAEKVKGEAAP